MVVLIIPKIVKRFARPFVLHGYQCWLVGGAVRDLIIHRSTHDYDIATNAQPNEVRILYPNAIPTGLRHGTVTVPFSGHNIEVTTFRTESNYRDGRRPEEVVFSTKIEDDISRRDFTINGIAAKIPEGRITDPFGGRQDLQERLIRAIGDPCQRFTEDGLRPIRACRLASQLGFTIQSETHRAIRKNLKTVQLVASERIGSELGKILLSRQPSAGLLSMKETGLLEIVIPELYCCTGIKHNQTTGRPEKYPEVDVFTHSLAACDASERDLSLRWAALLHDIGKATTMDKNIESCHQTTKSAHMAHRILNRLRFPRVLQDEVSHLIAHLMFKFEKDWPDAAVRRLITQVGLKNISKLISLRQADHLGSHEHPSSDSLSTNLKILANRVADMVKRNDALSIQDLVVKGNDLMKALKLKPGPHIGVLLQHLLDTVLEDPTLNNQDTLIKIAHNFHNTRLDIKIKSRPVTGL